MARKLGSLLPARLAACRPTIHAVRPPPPDLAGTLPRPTNLAVTWPDCATARPRSRWGDPAARRALPEAGGRP